MHTLQGTLRYSYELDESKSDARTLKLELEQDDSAAYYQWLLQKRYGTWLRLQPPMWGLHVTVIKHDEVVNKMDDWGLYEGERIAVRVYPERMERHWHYWSLTAESERLVEIRKFYGVRPDYRFHMSVGRQFEWQPRIIIPEVTHELDYYDDFKSAANELTI